MKPLFLKLQGFAGISKGLGKDLLELDLTSIPADKQLVAFVGHNGNGKTTILDNLQPYRVMPSHSTTLGPGGFSYWDHFTGLTASKELEWEHDSRRFRSSFAFKVKSRKADYYLYTWAEETKSWEPYVTPEGVKSDSKAETYDKCVDSVLGSPERFFTSQFAAQHRKALSSYGDTDVKSLLASMLNHKLFGQLKVKAGMVAKLLKFQLDGLQDELAQARAADASIEEAQLQLVQHEVRTKALAQQVETNEQACAVARSNLATIEAKRDAQSKDAEQAAFLRTQIANATASAHGAKAKLQELLVADLARTKSELDRIKSEDVTARQELKSVDSDIERLTAVLANKANIEQAIEAIPDAQARVKCAEDAINDAQRKLSDLMPLRARLQQLNEQLANIQAAGEGKKIMLSQLTETAALVDVVPCKGMAMQTSCQLLSHANEAKSKIPTDTAAFEKLRNDYKAVRTEVAELRGKLDVEPALQAGIEQATKERRASQVQLDSVKAWASRIELLQVAMTQLPDRQLQKQKLNLVIEQAAHKIALLNQSSNEVKAANIAAMSEVEEKHRVEVSALQQRLESLSKPVSESEVQSYANQLSAAQRSVVESKARLHTHNDGKANLLAKIEVLNNMKEKSKETIAQASRLQDEIADWKLMEKGMDGLVALSIDDAGPEISHICNELLADDLDGRFTVRLDTQRELASGNQKETFDIMVFDSRGGEGIPISLMSGGEKVWVNECLTRAIALHISDNGANGYQTLFTDETDGAFDPDRKRNFMQMKRKVLQRGGYEREYFISQTPEVWEMADHIIYMDSLK